MKTSLALLMAISSTSSLADEPKPWSPVEREVAIIGCARAIAEPAYDGYLKRNNLADPAPEKREKAVELAIATDGPIWNMCVCVMDEVAHRWKPSQLQAHQSEVDALSIQLANGKCKPEL